MWCKCQCKCSSWKGKGFEEEKNNEEGLFGKPLPLISTLSRDCGARSDQPGVLPTVGATWVNQLGEQLHPEDQQESVHCVKAGKFRFGVVNLKKNISQSIFNEIYQKLYDDM